MSVHLPWEKNLFWVKHFPRDTSTWSGLNQFQGNGIVTFLVLYQWFSTGVPRNPWVLRKALRVPPIYELDVYLLVNCCKRCRQIVLKWRKGAANQCRLWNPVLYNRVIHFQEKTSCSKYTSKIMIVSRSVQLFCFFEKAQESTVEEWVCVGS